jgi:hypothetical protein
VFVTARESSGRTFSLGREVPLADETDALARRWVGEPRNPGKPIPQLHELAAPADLFAGMERDDIPPPDLLLRDR